MTSTKKPAGAKALATCEAEARMLAIDGARQIGAYLARMRDNYAADRSIGAEKAYLWHEECVVYLLENGVAPAEVAAANTLPGDTWRAFQVFEAWLLATRGVVTFDQAYEVATRKAPQPLDVFLMIAIANAFGKAERWLNATEEMLAQKRGIAALPRQKDPVRARMVKALSWFRAHDNTLLEALQSMCEEPHEDLTVTYLTRGRWRVEDDRGNPDDDCTRQWSKKALEAMWAEAGEKKS